MSYVVYFHPIGYYAKNQTTYEWQFTKDISKALIYKKIKAAEERVDAGLQLIRQYNRNPAAYNRSADLYKTEHIEIKKIEETIKEIGLEKSYNLLGPEEGMEMPAGVFIKKK